MEPRTVKIHVERDFSFVEFEIMADPFTGEGFPSPEQLRCVWDKLPEKGTQPVGGNGLRQTPASATRNLKRGITRPDPPATANQRRVLEAYGEWQDGMTKSEATRILTELGR